MFQQFHTHYRCESDNIEASQELIDEYRTRVPEGLIEIWKRSGFGKYNNGILEIINPKEYEDILWIYLGEEKEGYTPFALTGFGELFYYRKFSEVDEDVCIIDIQHRTIETLVWSMESFFEDFLQSSEDRAFWLREELFKKAITEQGSLKNGEIFSFTPVLMLGGSETIEHLQKADAGTYLHLVFDMTTPE